MHAYRKLIEEQMKARELSGSDLARKSGVTRQRISQILRSDKSRLVHVPDTTTVEGFARAFALPPEAVWTAVAEAMGLPRFVVPPITHQVKDVSNEQLIQELASRLGLVATVRPQDSKDAPQAAEDQKTEAGFGPVPEESATEEVTRDHPKRDPS